MRATFITGFPGFLGRRLVTKLAERDQRFVLLVEPRFAEAARAAIDDVAALAFRSADRFEILAGDITQPRLGLDASTVRRLSDDIDQVWHLAAIYDLGVGRSLAERVNVEGTRNVNDLVARLDRLERYHYVSTFAVAGRRTGVVRERELEHRAGFHNHYEETKYRAELEVKRLMERGLPTTIYRPGSIVGSSKDGITAKFDGPYMVLELMSRLPPPLNLLNFGSSEVGFQMVPVDFVVDAMCALAGQPDTAFRTFHLTDPAPATTAEICDLFCRELHGVGTLATAPEVAVRAFTASGIPAALGLQREANPYFFHRCRYDCVSTLDALDGTGIEVPALATYVDRLVSFWRSNRQLGLGAARLAA